MSRISLALPTNEELTFWSTSGQKLETYSLTQYQPGGPNTLPQLVATQTGTNYYFGGKLVKNAGGYVTPDRLGSIGKYFPYGQERPSATTDGKEKFATYFRDSETGLDYAENRYHQPGMGRFVTPDPWNGSGKPNDPGSWNRYSYGKGDPVNSLDPHGLSSDYPDYCDIYGDPNSPYGYDPHCSAFYNPFPPDQRVTDGGDDDAEANYRQWMAQLQAAWEAGVTEAGKRLSQQDCAALFSAAGTYNSSIVVPMSALDASDPVGLLQQYVGKGWLSYSSDFLPTGVQLGSGGNVPFGTGDTDLWNTGGVTSYKNTAYVNSAGTKVGVNMIFMNVSSFAFTGLGYFPSAGGFAPVGSKVSAFAGLSQPEILAAAIIHELLHAVGAIPSDSTSVGQSGINSNTVKQGCF